MLLFSFVGPEILVILFMFGGIYLIIKVITNSNKIKSLDKEVKYLRERMDKQR